MSDKIDVKGLADYAVSEGTQHSENGQWETTFTELYYHFGAALTPDNDACKEFAEELRTRQEVEDLTITEDGIDVTYKPEYCENLVTAEKEESIETLLERYDAEDLDYKDAVKEIVAKEYEAFEKEMTEGKTAMDVFANNYQIYVKTELMRTICEEVEFDDEVYKALYQDRGNILKNLHEDFIGEPEASLNTRGDAAEFIEGYCHRYHGEIMDEGQTQGIKM